MKLLLDENLSRRLVPFLQHDYPGISQVVLLGLESASDKDVWLKAKTDGYVNSDPRCRFSRAVTGLGATAESYLATHIQSIQSATLSALIDNSEAIMASLFGNDLACIEILP
jgi:hypothetical protein